MEKKETWDPTKLIKFTWQISPLEIYDIAVDNMNRKSIGVREAWRRMHRNLDLPQIHKGISIILIP
jgi:hypothetical protein